MVDELLHPLAVVGLLNIGLGLTVTVTVKDAPVQVPDVGMTV